MGHCKACDLFFIIFCLFCFVLYVNPQNFSAPSIAAAKERNALVKKQLDEKSNQEKMIYACLNRLTIEYKHETAKNGGAYTRAIKHVFSYKNDKCEERIDEYFIDGYV
ncbi:hypothetical protein [Pseudomonas nitroreducens]|uniref:hypothetical protein n=1 Tax=Pseudomonas nitroreducens TaxID=46680 RepID=UPI001873A35C|nr:hypothetical protein [Pseudomonas nitritireducens]